MKRANTLTKPAAASEDRSAELTIVLKAGSTADALKEIRSGRFNHVLQSDRLDHKNARERVKKFEALSSFDPVEIERLWLTGAYPYQETHFSTPFTKDSAVKELVDYAKITKALGRRLPQIETVIAELALNGLYSSASAYKSLFGLDFNFKSECRLRIAYDTTRVLLSCWDPVGSLQREKVLDRLIELFESEEPIEINRSSLRQSGFGLKLVMDNSSDLMVFSTKMRETYIGCSLPLKGPAALLETRSKCLHFMVRS